MLFSVPANYIRQWLYCPRIVYYMELTFFKPQYPAWVGQGDAFHHSETQRWQRRNLSRFGLDKGKLHFNFTLKDDTLPFHGIADMIVESEKEVIPIEFKMGSPYQKKGGILQLAAYGALCEKVFSKPCPYGFLTEGLNKLHKVNFPSELLNNLFDCVDQIQRMIMKGIKPDSAASPNQCTNCEYLNQCNDRE